MRERAEREAREREDMAVAERAPVQESPLWQCEHYQRRCSVVSMLWSVVPVPPLSQWIRGM